MLASIHPLGERGRGQRWSVTVLAHLAGTLLGAGLLGAVAGRVGAAAGLEEGATGGNLAGAVAVLAAAGVAIDLGVGGLRVPTIHRQVDEDWLQRYRGWVYGLGFGFQLGLGVVTVVNSFTMYLTVALAFLSGSTAAGLLIGMVFGAVRGAVVLAGATVQDASQLHVLHRRIKGWEAPSRRLAVVAQALVAVGAAGVWLVVAG